MDQDVSAVVDMMSDAFGIEETINTLLGGPMENYNVELKITVPIMVCEIPSLTGREGAVDHAVELFDNHQLDHLIYQMLTNGLGEAEVCKVYKEEK